MKVDLEKVKRAYEKLKELGKDFIKDKIGLATGFFSDR